MYKHKISFVRDLPELFPDLVTTEQHPGFNIMLLLFFALSTENNFTRSALIDKTINVN